MEENIDSPTCVPVWPIAGVTELKGFDQGDKINDEGVDDLEQTELKDLTDSGMSLCAL